MGRLILTDGLDYLFRLDTNFSVEYNTSPQCAWYAMCQSIDLCKFDLVWVFVCLDVGWVVCFCLVVAADCEVWLFLPFLTTIHRKGT
jgi:hypothetical protein